jgi:type II secretory ATPase GspE/PulE/Tfp pilus assembly ATPase PilB-like protein
VISAEDLSADEAVPRLLDAATQLNVSDLFLHTDEDKVTVLARHLGHVRLLTTLPLEQGRRCLSHIKAVAGMDVTERRRPLDGRWLYESAGRKLDLRINTIPTLHGEDFTLRLLERNPQMLELSYLGMPRREINQLTAMLSGPGGLILVTGPTGSGKTTTLYACLRHLNNGERKISTIEDPIEYALEGIRQSQVNPRLELDFPDLLRSVLRQSPDVIMVGEVRDPVTAATVVQAASSGHLVLATLHAPTSAGGVQSMLQFGVRPYFLASTLRGVVAQRLVRTLCPACKVAFDLSQAPGTFDEYRPWLSAEEGQTLYAARGCSACFSTGYSQRTGLFEMMTITAPLRKLITENQTTQAIHKKAVEAGLSEFRLAAMLKVARGETTVEEVLRVVPTEYLGLEDM